MSNPMPPSTSATSSRTSSSTQATTSKQTVSPDDDEFIRSKILLLGLRRSGKTSIRHVLFENKKPSKNFIETDMTVQMSKIKIDSIIPLEVWDVPGHANPEKVMEELGVPLSTFSTLIFVIDICDNYPRAIEYLLYFFTNAYKENQEINLEVFIHKADARAEDYRNENARNIQLRIFDELADLPPLTLNNASAPNSGTSTPSVTTIEPAQIPIVFHLTSVLEHHLLQEAFARVLMRLLAPACLPYLEELLNAFCGSSHASKVFLFDTRTKVYVATDSSPVDSATHNLCCDYVHMLNSFGSLYKSSTASPSRQERRIRPPAAVPATSSSAASSPAPSSPRPDFKHSQTPTSRSAAASRAPTPTHTSGASPSTSLAPGTSPAAVFSAASVIAPSRSRTNSHNSNSTRAAESKQQVLQQQQQQSPPKPSKPAFFPSCSTTLTPFNTLTYHAITPHLALVAVLPSHVWQTKRGLIEYNIVFFREGIQEIFDVEQEARRRKPSSTPGSQTPGSTRK